MSAVFRLAYLDLSTPSLDAALDYYAGVLGLVATHRNGSSAYLSVGLDDHNIGLVRADRPSVGAIGFQVAPATDLADLAARLEAGGFPVARKGDARPGVRELIECEVGGHTFQVFAEMASTAPGFSGRGVAPLRLGHLAITSREAPRVVAYLQTALGFHPTDWFAGLATFLTCNREHHVMNVIDAPFDTMHHLAFELDGRDHQFRAADLLAQRNMPTQWGPARHTAGHNVASYHYGADGALIELYNDMDVFVPELGYCEPRPWHEEIPQRPRTWPLASMCRWDTRFEFDLAAATFGTQG